MEIGLFVTEKDVVSLSVLSGNLDPDKLIQWIHIAQDTHVQNALGTDLFVRLKTGVIDDDLTANEISLLDNYVKDMTIHWALVVAIGFLPYSVSNNGVFKLSEENSEVLDKEEIDSLVQKHRNLAEFYTKNFINYMCYNHTLFPEYDTNTNEETKPKKDLNFNTWFY